MLGTTMILFINLVIFIGFPVLIGVYVYRDAKSRGMNAALWTLIAIVAPALIGFIIYLLVRGSYSDLKCPNCDTRITEQYVSCPNCGTKLRTTCPNCSFPVEKEWKVCPKCASPLPEDYEGVTEPIRKKDRTLGKILLAVILIPILLIIMMVFSFSAFSTSSGAAGVTSIPVDEYLQEADNPQIKEWLDGCSEDSSKAYVLKHESTQDDEIKIHYLVYLPQLVEQPQVSISPATGMFGHTLKLEFPDENGNAGNTILLITCSGEPSSKLKIYYGGNKVNCEITEVDYSLDISDSSSELQDGVTIYEQKEVIPVD